jgi:hypothetical protein
LDFKIIVQCPATREIKPYKIKSAPSCEWAREVARIVAEATVGQPVSIIKIIKMEAKHEIRQL